VTHDNQHGFEVVDEDHVVFNVLLLDSLVALVEELLPFYVAGILLFKPEHPFLPFLIYILHPDGVTAFVHEIRVFEVKWRARGFV